MEATAQKLEVISYRVPMPQDFMRVTVEKRAKGWSICCGSEVMNGLGVWEYEPQPSERDAAFCARTRFALGAVKTLINKHVLARHGITVR